MTRDEFRDYVEFLHSQNEISYDVYSGLIDGIDTLEQEPCEDCISREWLKQDLTHTPTEEEMLAYINAAPSVIPEPKTGRWEFEKTIFDRFGGTVRCTSCRKKWKVYDEMRWEKEHKYCPNCGAKMNEE